MEEYRGFIRYINEYRRDWQMIIERTRLDAVDLDRLLDEGLDAIVATSVMTDDAIERISKMEIPTVAIMSEQKPLSTRGSRLAFVDIDSHAVGVTAAKFLLGLDAISDFACVGESDQDKWSVCRANAFAEELARHGVQSKVCLIEKQKHRCGLGELTPWLRSLVKPAALFVTCDLLAAEVLDQCEYDGIRVPEDLAVVGVDNEFILCAHTHPPLSSIQPDFEREGYESAKKIDLMLRGRFVPRMTVCSVTNVVARQSTEASSPAGKIVSRAREIVQNDFANRSLDVGKIAKQLKVSRRLLDLRYRQITGKTVLDDLRFLRIERVKELLTTTSLTLSEIAQMSGFASESYLSRVFSSTCGCTPRSFRSLP